MTPTVASGPSSSSGWSTGSSASGASGARPTRTPSSSPASSAGWPASKRPRLTRSPSLPRRSPPDGRAVGGMNITVDPPAFSIVDYEPERIGAVAGEVAALTGLPDDVRIEVVVEEDNPFGKTAIVVDGRSVRMVIEGGAFEDPQELRQFSEANARLVLGRLLFRAAD